MQLNLSLAAKTRFRKKFKSVFAQRNTVEAIPDIVFNKMMDPAQRLIVSTFKTAENDIKSRFPKVPEPGVTQGNMQYSVVSDAFREEFTKFKTKGKYGFSFQFPAHPSILNKKTRLGGKSNLKNIPVWQLWEKGKIYWSPEEGKTWVFIPISETGKFGRGFMIKVKNPSKFTLDVLQRKKTSAFPKARKYMKSRKPIVSKEIRKYFQKAWKSYGNE